ncbi:MAG: inositol monophosphatase, partial [Tatlockia sp.]|nr:inositol monophosphatase [Tatlockia sp.]
ASYNLLTVANATTLGAVESTPKIWDIAAVWVIAQAAGCTWMSLNPQLMFPLTPNKDYGSFSFPTLLVSRPDLLPIFQPFVDLVKL